MRKQQPRLHSFFTQREPKRLRTPEEQRAEIERVAREHGADLSEDAFNEALRKVARQSGQG